MTGFAPVIHVGVAPDSSVGRKLDRVDGRDKPRHLQLADVGEERIPLRKRTELER